MTNSACAEHHGAGEPEPDPAMYNTHQPHSPSDSQDTYLSVKELAAYWHLSKKTIYRWVHNGTIPALSGGRGKAIRINLREASAALRRKPPRTLPQHVRRLIASQGLGPASTDPATALVADGSSRLSVGSNHNKPNTPPARRRGRKPTLLSTVSHEN